MESADNLSGKWYRTEVIEFADKGFAQALDDIFGRMADHYVDIAAFLLAAAVTRIVISMLLASVTTADASNSPADNGADASFLDFSKLGHNDSVHFLDL